MRFAAFLVCALLQAQEPDTKTLIESATAAHMKGDYEAARQSLLNAWDLAQQTAPADPLRYDILKRLTSVRAAAGEFADADNFLQMAINWRENTLGANDPKIADDLLLSASFCRGMKNFDRAQAIITRVMALHRTAFGADSTPVADDFSRLAQVYMERKLVDAAIVALNQAIAMRAKISGPLDPSLVPELDRLAAAHITKRAYDKSEAAYRQALVIRETILGKFDADLIASVDGLAYSLFGQKKYDDAEPIYRRLIELWTKSVGPDHPMVAVAYDKVAMFYIDQKKYDEAREAQNQSNAIRAHFLATGLSIAATQETAQEHRPEAIAIYKRALTLLDPPNPIYNEMRADIEDFVKGMEALLAKPPLRKATPKKK